jgi:hypothetical protein
MSIALQYFVSSKRLVSLFINYATIVIMMLLYVCRNMYSYFEFVTLLEFHV